MTKELIKADARDLELELWLRRRNSGSIVWTTKQGVQVPINEMTDQHLINSLNMLERTDPVWEGLDGDWQG